RFVSCLRRSRAGAVHRIQTLLPQRHQEGRSAAHATGSPDAQPQASLHPVSVANSLAVPRIRIIEHRNGTGPSCGEPMTTRREFLSGLAAAGISAQPIFRESAIKSLFRANVIAGDRPPSAIADDESYWAEIQRAFDSDRTMINLNNGGC